MSVEAGVADPSGLRRKAESRSADSEARHVINWPRWFVGIGAVIGILTILTTPSLRGPDEFNHLVRVATISHGSLVAPPGDVALSGYGVDGCLNALHHQVDDWFRLHERYGWGHQFDDPPCSEPFQAHSPKAGSLIGNVEVNPPLPYLPAAVGFRIGRATGGAVWTVALARAFQLCAYLALVWFALRLLPFGRPFLTVTALIPGAIQNAATVSADPISTAVAFVVIAATSRFIVNARDGRPAPATSVVAGYCFSVFVLALCKPAVLPIVGVALLVPSQIFGSLRRRIVALAVTLSAALGAGVLWASRVSSQVRISMFFGADSLEMRQWIAAHPVDFVIAALRGWTDLRAVRLTLFTFLAGPVSLVAVYGLTAAVLIALVFAYCGDRPYWRVNGDGFIARVFPRWRVLRIGLVAAIVFAGFWLIELGVALSVATPSSRIIAGIQGRYFIPYLPLALLVSAGRRPTDHGRRLAASVLAVVVIIGVNLWSLVAALQTWYT